MKDNQKILHDRNKIIMKPKDIMIMKENENDRSFLKLMDFIIFNKFSFF